MIGITLKFKLEFDFNNNQFGQVCFVCLLFALCCPSVLGYAGVCQSVRSHTALMDKNKRKGVVMPDVNGNTGNLITTPAASDEYKRRYELRDYKQEKSMLHWKVSHQVKPRLVFVIRAAQ